MTVVKEKEKVDDAAEQRRSVWIDASPKQGGRMSVGLH